MEETKRIGKKTLAKFIFSLTCFFSAMTLMPELSFYRYPFFERYLDFFYIAFLFLASKKSSVMRQNVDLLLMISFTVIFLSSIFAFINFGELYFLVEYRPYFLTAASILVLVLLNRKLDAQIIISTIPVLFIFLLINFLLSVAYAEFYRPGVFGESNYDLAYLAVIILALFHQNGKSRIQYMLLILFVIISQSRTAMIVAAAVGLLKARNLKGQAIFIASIPVLYFLFQGRFWDESTSDFTSVIEQLDRVQMVLAYISATMEYPQLLLFGQPFSSVTFTSETMGFYLETQQVSAQLGFNTPSNFHGHLLRGFLLLGIPIYLLFLTAILIRVYHIHGRNSFYFALIVIMGTAISQSIFSHPFSGSLFAIVCLVGFSERTIKRE